MGKTYTTLQTAIANYLNRNDLTTPIQDAIGIVQRRLERNNDWKCMRASATGTLTLSSPYLAYPTRYKNTFAFFVLNTDGRYQRLDHNRMPWGFEVYPYISAITGFPEVFSEDDANSRIILRDTPDSAYTYVWYYHNTLQELSGSVSTNWWADNAWELLLYGSLVELAAYMVEDERIPLWQGLYEKMFTELRNREDIAEMSGSSQYIKSNPTVV